MAGSASRTDARSAGAASLIVADLPAGDRPGLRRVQLVAPTSTDERLRLAGANTDGWLYLVTVTGTTGARTGLSTSLAQLAERARIAAPGVPLYAGFGISTPADARAAAELTDGVVVGSRALEAAEAGPASLRGIRPLAAGRARLATWDLPRIGYRRRPPAGDSRNAVPGIQPSSTLINTGDVVMCGGAHAHSAAKGDTPWERSSRWLRRSASGSFCARPRSQSPRSCRPQGSQPTGRPVSTPTADWSSSKPRRSRLVVEQDRAEGRLVVRPDRSEGRLELSLQGERAPLGPQPSGKARLPESN